MVLSHVWETKYNLFINIHEKKKPRVPGEKIQARLI